MKFKTILLASIICICFSCNVQDGEIQGVYTAQNQINNIDTLTIFQNGIFKKRTYRKTDNSLIFENIGKWKFKEGRITLIDFFFDADEKFEKNFDNFKGMQITSSFVVKKESGKVVFDFLEDKGYYRYRKQ